MNVEIVETKSHYRFRDLPRGTVFVYDNALTLRVKISDIKYISLADKTVYEAAPAESVIPVNIIAVKVEKVP